MALECPDCGGDIRLIAFITEPGAIRKILTHLGEPLERPPVSPARGPPTDWGELVQVHDERRRLSGTGRRAARDRYPQPLSPAGHEASTKPPGGRPRRDPAPTPEKRHFKGKPGVPEATLGSSLGVQEDHALGSRVAHQLGIGCGRTIDRAILGTKIATRFLVLTKTKEPVVEEHVREVEPVSSLPCRECRSHARPSRYRRACRSCRLPAL